MQPFLCEDNNSRRWGPPAIAKPYQEPQRAQEVPFFEATGPHVRARPDDLPENINVRGKVVVVYRDYQWTCAYEDGKIAVRLGMELCTPVSTGRRGEATETPITDPRQGVQRIIWMDEHHCSSTLPRPNTGCDDGGAPMPLAASFGNGIAFHAGDVRRSSVPLNAPWGESHACVRMPTTMAEVFFFNYFDLQTQVIVTWSPQTYFRDWETESW